MESSKESAGPSTPFQLEMGLQAINATVTPLDLTLPASPDRRSSRAESLSPASSSSSSITDLASRLGPSASSSAAAIQAAKDADAKSSALKALAGIGKVVSKSRQVDAEALQAIKLQRAKVKAEGGPGSVGSHHRHTRTLSTESIPSLPELSGTSLPTTATASGGAFSTPSTSSSMMPPPPSRGHRRSHSGIPLSNSGGHLAGANTPGSGGSGGGSSSHLQGSTPVMPPCTTPQSYYELLSGMGLADLLALQTAVDNEIQIQLSAAGLSHLNMGIVPSPTGTHSPQSPAEVLFSAQYASAVLASQQQQQQQQQQHQQHQQQQLQQQRAHSSSGSLGHSPVYGRSPKKGVPPFSSTGSGGSGGGSVGAGSDAIFHHHARSRSIDTMLLYRSSSPLTPDSGGSSGGLTAAASSNLSLGGLESGFHIDLASMEDCVGGAQPPPTARSLDVGAPQPPPAPSAAFTSTDFSFLGASGSSLLAPTTEVDVAPSPFTVRSSPSSLGQPSLLQQYEMDQRQQQNHASIQQTQQLPLLFGNLQLGSLDPWR